MRKFTCPPARENALVKAELGFTQAIARMNISAEASTVLVDLASDVIDAALSAGSTTAAGLPASGAPFNAAKTLPEWAAYDIDRARRSWDRFYAEVSRAMRIR